MDTARRRRVMANTLVVTSLNSDKRLAQYRSTDLPSEVELLEAFGPCAVYDLTDGMRPVGYVVPRAGGDVEWRSFAERRA
jgi:hypothetical protein